MAVTVSPDRTASKERVITEVTENEETQHSPENGEV